jgi:CHAT domain-containing protein
MEDFYDNLWRRGLPKLEALRMAQLGVLDDPGRVARRAEEFAEARKGRGPVRPLSSSSAGPSPRRGPAVWWAAFTLSGEWR